MGEPIRIDLPFPTSTNKLWKRGRTGMYRSPEYMTWINAAGWQLATQKPGCITGNYVIRIDLERRGRKRIDAGNFEKSVSDLLVKHGVITDDSYAERITIGWSDRVSGCRVTLREVAKPVRQREAA